MYLRRLFSLCIILFSCFSLVAQKQKTDSLLNILKHTATRDTNRVIVLNSVAEIYKITKPDSAIELAQEAITISNELRYGRGLTNAASHKGSALISKGKYDDAIKNYDEHAPVILKYGFPRGYCMLRMRKGYAYYNSGRASDAIAAFKSAIPESEQYKQYDVLSDVQRGIGMSYTSVGDHQKATEAFIQAIQAAELSSLPSQVGYTYITLGNSQINQKDSAGALSSYRHALLILDTMHNDYGRAGCYICIGNVYLYQKKYDSALVNYNKCLQIREAMNNDPAGIAGIKENIATVLLEQGKPEQALIYFREGLEVFLTLNNQEGIAGSYANMGNAYRAMKEYTEAEKYYVAALGPARKSGSNNFIRESFKGLAEVYYQTGRYKEAAEYKDSLIRISDIIIGEQHSAESKEIEARFRNQQKEEEIAYLQETGAQQAELAAKQQQIIVAISVGLALVFLLMLVAVRANAQRKKANHQLKEQNLVIAEKNKDITDSITYARRIQQSVLPDQKVLFDNVADALIFYQPRDIVSGDFFWFRKEGQRLYIACADCTGHGVPGALVSVVGVNLLEQIVTANKSVSTGALLDELHKMMYTALHKDSLSRGSTDGMDIALICIDRAKNVVEFSGASRSLLHFNGETLTQIKGHRFSIGGVKDVDGGSSFGMQEFPIRPGDACYLFTDGYADQFGGSSNKKFMSKNFTDLIAKNTQANMKSQQSILEKTFREWMGKNSQVDDVLVIGVRL